MSFHLSRPRVAVSQVDHDAGRGGNGFQAGFAVSQSAVIGDSAVLFPMMAPMVKLSFSSADRRVLFVVLAFISFCFYLFYYLDQPS